MLFEILKSMMINLCRCLLYGLIVYSGACWAVTIDQTTELVIPVDNYTPKITSADVARVVPLDMNPGDSAGRVINRIADRGLGLWFDRVLKESSVGKLAEAAQETLKTDLEVAPTEEGAVAHKVNLEVDAFAAQAVVKYSGWVKAQVRVGARGTDIVLREKIFEDKDLLISHTSTREQALSMISMGWSW